VEYRRESFQSTTPEVSASAREQEFEQLFSFFDDSLYMVWSTHDKAGDLPTQLFCCCQGRKRARIDDTLAVF
jgi:hypothetical protein